MLDRSLHHRFPWRYLMVMVGFFLSGFAGLVYEICWIRKAALVFGSTIDAFSTVVAVFFAGLAIGSYWFGRWGPRWPNKAIYSRRWPIFDRRLGFSLTMSTL